MFIRILVRYLEYEEKTKMSASAYPGLEHRPLKKARFGNVGPDVYPQEPKQKEVYFLTDCSYRIASDITKACTVRLGLVLPQYMSLVSHRSVTKNCIFLVTGPGLTKTPF